MDRTLCIKILPSDQQIVAFRGLMAHYAQLCNFLGGIASREKIKNRQELHKRAYAEARSTCGAHSQVTCLALVQVAGAYKTLGKLGYLAADKEWPALSFSSKGSVPFDARTYRQVDGGFSMYTPQGRTIVPWAPGGRQIAYLKKGTMQTARLVGKRNKWFLHISIRQPDAVPAPGGDVLGVDVGEVTLAATSTGKIFKGNRLRHERDVYLAKRAQLQRNGSQSAKKQLRKASGRERRHTQQENHVVSKQVVAEAVKAGVITISMEDLTHHRERAAPSWSPKATGGSGK